jgi:hypothetical protein
MTEPQKAQRMRRDQASAYLKNTWGIDRAPATLAKDACNGTGAVIQFVGIFPYYTPESLDDFARTLLGQPTRQARRHERRADRSEQLGGGK